MKLKLVTLFLSLQLMVSAQENLLFKQGDRVCFVGNSITRNGEFYKNILLYYITRFPNEPVTFFNCGISGDACSQVLNRMDSDILVHQPTHAIIMLGMNDVYRSLYGSTPTNNSDTLQKRRNALLTYATRYDSIVKIFIDNNVKVILQKPTIYDETAITNEPNHLGVNEALKLCGDSVVGLLAKKYQLPVIDYWSILNNKNIELQKKDPAASIIGKDRIHPGSAGHLIMAYQFLKTTKAPRFVADIFVKKNIKTSNSNSKYCSISDYKVTSDSTLFTVQENALPFPTKANQQLALTLVPFINELSCEKLRVEVDDNSTDSSYQLFIDTTYIRTYTRTELAAGILLTRYTKAPQYLPALKVSMILDTIWNTITDLRTIAFIRSNFLKDYKGNNNDSTQICKYLDALFKARNIPKNDFILNEYSRYKTFMFSKELLEKQVEDRLRIAYSIAANAPKKYVFKLVKEKHS